MSGTRLGLATVVRVGIQRQRRRLITLALVVGSSVATVAAGLCLGSHVAASVDTSGGSEVARRITVYDDGRRLTPAVLAELDEIAGVSRIDPVLEVVVGLTRSGSVLTLMATSMKTVPLIEGRLPSGGLTRDQVVLPATADGVGLSDLVGRTTSLEYTRGLRAGVGVGEELTARVVAVSDPSFQVDAPLAGYASAELVVELASARAGVSPRRYLEEVGYHRLLLTADTVADARRLTEELQSRGLHAVSDLQRMAEVPGVLQLVRVATAALFALLGSIALVSSMAVAQASAAERATDFAVMKAFGWGRIRIAGCFVTEVAVVTLAAAGVGAVAGVGLGLGLGSGIRDAVTDGALGAMAVPWSPLVAEAVVLPLAAVATSALVVLRATCRPVVDVLRDAR